MQFTLADPNNPTSPDVIQRLNAMVKMTTEDDGDEEVEQGISRANSADPDDEDEDDDGELETSDETDDPAKPGKAEKKRKRKLKLARLRRKTKARAYEFSGGSDVLGMAFLEISRIVDLPPERNSKDLSQTAATQ